MHRSTLRAPWALALTVALALTLTLSIVAILAGCGSGDDTTTTAAAAGGDSSTVTTTAPADTATTAGASASDASWQTVQDRGALVVGMCAEYPPFESRGDDNKPVGFDVDLANALGEKLGVDVRLLDTAWEGLLGGILKGDSDVLITAMSAEEASAENVNTSDPYYDLAEVIVVPKDNTTIKSVADLQGKVVGVQSACSAEKAVDRLTGLKEIKRYNRNPEALLDLKNGRVEAVVVGEAYAATEAKNDPDVKVVVGAPVATNSLVFVSKAGGDALTAKLNAALADLKTDGTYDALVKKWLALN